MGKAIGLGPQPHVRMKQLAEEYGEVMSLQMGSGQPWVVLSSPEAVHEAFVQRGSNFSARPMVPSMGISSGGGQGFAANKLTPELKALRRMAFSQLFSPQQVSASEERLHREALALTSHLGRANPSPWGNISELRPALRQAVTNMAMGYALSLRVPFDTERTPLEAFPPMDDAQQGTAVELADVVGEIWSYLTDVNTTFLDLVAPDLSGGGAAGVHTPLTRLVARRNKLLLRLIAQRRRLRRSSGSRPIAVMDSSAAAEDADDMLDVMISAGLPDDDILYVLIDMFVAGVNTVASTLEWALLLTAAEPREQSRARADAVASPGGGRLARAGEVPYVDALLLEVLRLKQPLLLPREATADSEVSGFRVRKGTVVYANNYALTHGTEPLARA
eukprot:jgi/Tetstr1/463451/TSEL_008344.t1